METNFSKLKISLWSMMAVVLSLVVAGCDDDDDSIVGHAPVLKTDSTEQTVGQSGGSAVISFQIENPVKGSEARATAAADWVKSICTEVNGTEGKVLLDLMRNEAQDSRETQVTVSYPQAKDLTFKVIQLGLSQSTIVLDSDMVEVSAAGGVTELGFEITNPQKDAILTAEIADSWVGDFTCRMADNKLSFIVQKNDTGTVREGKITIKYPSAASVTLTVRQAAAATGEPVVMTRVPMAIFQQTDNTITNYYVVMTSVPCDMDQQSGQITMKEPGYMIALDLYAVAAEKGILPDGTYRASADSQDKTYGTNYTFMKYLAASGSEELLQLADEVVIERKEGIYRITTSYTSKSGEIVPVEFGGEIIFKDAAQQGGGGALPPIGRDVEINGYSAIGVYFGNLLQSDTGMMVVNIMDKTYADDNSKGQGGMAFSMCVFTQLFPQTNLISLVPGTYKVATNFAKMSWMPGVEINNMGSVIPFGTYVQCDDGSQMGSFEFAQGGEIIIEQATTGYTIKYNLVSNRGNKITGAYSGVVEIQDASNDENKDDGTSTLTNDHDMDLSNITRARMFPLGDVEDADGTILTHNRIDIGSRSGWDKDETLKTGDTFTMDLVMEKQDAGKLAPGTYEITTDRFPASMRPGAAIRGYIWDGEYMATGWLHYDVTRPYDMFLDGHAAAYDGTIIVEKSAKGDNCFKFTIDMVCVRKMHVRGTWEGQVINAQDESPVEEGTSVIVPTEEPTRVMSCKAVRSASGLVKAQLAKRFFKADK